MKSDDRDTSVDKDCMFCEIIVCVCVCVCVLKPGIMAYTLHGQFTCVPVYTV